MSEDLAGSIPAFERIEAIALDVPLPRSFSGNGYRVTHRTAVFTRVHFAGGLSGEGLNMVGESAMLAPVAGCIRDEIAPLLAGSRLGPESCWQRMDRVTNRVDRDPRVAIRALSCVDTAVWDALGKLAGLPLYRLWGGDRETLTVIANGGYQSGGDLSAFGDEMVELKSLGIGGCKFKVGGDPAADAARTQAARQAAGHNFILCADANRAWTAAQAIDYCRRTEGMGLAWLEEPCHWRLARTADRHVREVTGVPICAGQSEVSSTHCRELLIGGSVDICNFDASWGGGPTEWHRVAGLAASLGITMTQHGEPHLGAHLAASIAHGGYMETHHPDRDPIFHRLMTGRAALKDGTYSIPDSPGWGISLDWDEMRRYVVA